MNKEDIKKLKEMVAKDKSINMNKSDEKLAQYIMFRAKKKLNAKSGMVSDEEVVGWAKHFYMESKETIDKEFDVKPEPKTKTKPQTEQKPKPKPKPKPKKEQGQTTIFEFLD